MRLVSTLVAVSIFLCLLALLLQPGGVSAQFPYPIDQLPKKPDDEGPRLPNGKLQRDVIVEHEHKKNMEDLRRIHELSGKVLEDMEKQTAFVFSLSTLKELEEMEKLSKDVTKRFKKR